MQKAALYVRVSTTMQIDKDSLPFQRKELVNYSKYILGIDDYEIFEDAGYSGKNTDRPKFQEMMSRVRKKEFTHMLVWKIDRISRNLRDFTEMYDEIKKYNITFISKNEQFDTSTAMGEAMLKIILVFAELERKLTAERVYSIMLSRAEKGLWNGAPVPLGYEFNDEHKFPAVNAHEANTVRFIFDTYEETKSTSEVKHQLELRNITTKRNGSWTTKTIADIIRNPFYIGTYRYNYRYAPHGKIRPESEWVVAEDNHEAIISKEQYDLCNEIMDSHSSGRGIDRTRDNHVHVFSGLVNCNKCKKNYIATTDRPRSDGYRPSVYRCFNYVHNKKEHRVCSGSIGEVKLGPFVINYIANLVRANDFINLYGLNSTEKQLEKILLKGSPFNGIVGIEPEDLRNTYEVLVKSTGNILTDEPKKGFDIEKDAALSELKSSKQKFERALSRLEDLYLFSDDAMSEKDYLIKKRDFSKKLDDINEEIRERSKKFTQAVPEYDISFIKKATQYLIANSLVSNRAIDYNKFVKVVDKSILKEFMRSVVRSVGVEEDKRISSIEFINGISHRFIYRL